MEFAGAQGQSWGLRARRGRCLLSLVLKRGRFWGHGRQARPVFGRPSCPDLRRELPPAPWARSAGATGEGSADLSVSLFCLGDSTSFQYNHILCIWGFAYFSVLSRVLMGNEMRHRRPSAVWVRTASQVLKCENASNWSKLRKGPPPPSLAPLAAWVLV